jgi:hypothetical protein
MTIATESRDVRKTIDLMEKLDDKAMARIRDLHQKIQGQLRLLIRNINADASFANINMYLGNLDKTLNGVKELSDDPHYRQEIEALQAKIKAVFRENQKAGDEFNSHSDRLEDLVHWTIKAIEESVLNQLEDMAEDLAKIRRYCAESSTEFKRKHV